MSITKQKQSTTYNSPSIFALLVDDIRNMNEVEQKQLWMQLNQQSLAAEAKELDDGVTFNTLSEDCLLYTSPSPRDGLLSRMPSSA